jgi:predicted dienelactone hydrolase
MTTKKKTLILTAVFLIAVIVYATWEVFMPIHFDQPSGSYAIGTRSMEITDSSRTETALAGSAKYRRLILQFWYPAEHGNFQKAAYHPNPDYFVNQVHELFNNLPAVLLKRLARATTNSLAGASISPAEKNYPVIIYSHGMDGMRFMSTYQMEELASHGYIVVSIEHSFSATGTVFRDGSRGGITPYEKMENEEFANGMVAKWTADQIFTIDQLEKINQDTGNFFYQKLDLSETGVLGFSFGGAVSTNTLVFDKRIKAGVNLDGFYYGGNYSRGFQQPFMELRSEPALPEKVTEADLTMSHLSRARWKWVWFDEWNKRINAYTQGSKADHYHFTVHGADHFSFCDLPLMAPFPWILSPKTTRIHELTNQYTLAFFDEKLKGIKSPLLSEHRKLLK